MPILLDAYNILHVTGVLPPDLAGIDLEELATLVTGSRYRRESTILVCDGSPRRHQVRERSVHVRFAGPGQTADAAIIRLVRRSSAPRRLTIVTSDREIVQQVRRRRASVISSERFLANLAEDHAIRSSDRPSSDRRTDPPPASHPADRRQVEAWLRLFELDQAALAEESNHPAGSPTATPKSGPTDTPTRPSRKPSILEARTLSDIDPASLDELDVESLLDESGTDGSGGRDGTKSSPDDTPEK